LSYPQTDVFLVCFAIDLPSSLENVTYKWIPEITHHCPNTPFVLVGLQSDLRNDAETLRRLASRKQQPVSHAMGHQLAKKIKAFAYVECSAFERKGVNEVFATAVRAAVWYNENH
jgi:small GTP-binding protein